MNILREDHDSVTVLTLQGDLGKPDAQKLKETLENLLLDKRIFLVLDMEEIRYVDSHAIMTLLQLNREALGSGGGIILLRPRNVVKRFMSIGRVLELFDRYETKVEAIQAFNKNKEQEEEHKPADKLMVAAQKQRNILRRLLALLIQKGSIDQEEFHQEMNRSSRLVMEIFRKELERRN